MSEMTHSERPDAFKALMEDARANGRPELAYQSLGRPLSEAESAFADALMEIYAEGAMTPAEIAAAMVARGIEMPLSGGTGWTGDTLAAELRALNEDMDAAYQAGGFGA